MHVTICSDEVDPNGGGIGRYYTEVCRRAETASVSANLVSLANDTSDISGGSPLGGRASSYMRWAQAIWQIARTEGPLCMVAGNMRPIGVACRVLSAFRDIQYVLVFHGGDVLLETRASRGSMLRRRLTRSVLNRASAIICNSQSTRRNLEKLINLVGADADRDLPVVPLGTDPEVFYESKAERERTRAALELTDDELVLLSVSRLAKRKGHRAVIEMLTKLKADYPNLRYMIVGSGPYRDAIEACVASEGVSEMVIFAGRRVGDDLRAHYNAADLFVLPVPRPDSETHTEGFGIVYCEASACGLPVIASDVGGVSEAVADGVGGLLVPPGDPDALEGALRTLLESPALRSQFGAAGRKRVVDFYNWDRMAERFWEVVSQAYVETNARSSL